MTLYYLSLGSNLGDREQTLTRAAAMLGEQAGHICAQSDIFYSKPWGFESEHGFCNICLAIESELEPLELLHRTQEIERRLGREHKTLKDAASRPLQGYSDRTIDIDLLEAYKDGQELEIDTAELTLPHPLMHERDFVMIPLSEIKEQ